MAFCVCILYNEWNSCCSSSAQQIAERSGREMERESERTDVHVRSKQIAKRTYDTSSGKSTKRECMVYGSLLDTIHCVLICMRSHTSRQAYNLHIWRRRPTGEKIENTQKPHSFQLVLADVHLSHRPNRVANMFFHWIPNRNVDDAANKWMRKKTRIWRHRNENKKQVGGMCMRASYVC